MGTILPSTIVDKVTSSLLADTGKVRYTQAQMLAFLNEGCRVITSINPSAYSNYQNATLVAGTKQALPAATHLLMQPRRNMGLGGNTPGPTITPIESSVLDVLRPGWHAETVSAVIKHVIYDDENPRTFWVYPPAQATTQIECLFGLIPGDIIISTPILLDDMYEAPIMNYMVARAYERDAEYAGNQQMATYYYGLLAQQLGAKASAVMGASAQTEAKSGGNV